MRNHTQEHDDEEGEVKISDFLTVCSDWMPGQWGTERKRTSVAS